MHGLHPLLLGGAPPLSDEDLAWGEAALGVRLPRPLVSLLRERDGGLTRLDRVACPGCPPATFGGIAGVGEHARDTGGPSMVRLTAYARAELGLADGLVVLWGEEAEWLCLDYRASDEPAVALIDLASGLDLRVAPDVAGFLSNLGRSADAWILVLPTMEGLEAALAALGAEPKSSRTVRTWAWPAHRDRRGGPARLLLSSNDREGDPDFIDQPLDAPLLYLFASDASAVSTLAPALGARVVHTPPG